LVVLEPISQAVFDRLAGQTSDLLWQLTRVRVPASGDRVMRAGAAAVEFRARAVAWIARDAAGAFVLNVYDPSGKRLVTRRFALERNSSGLAESAAVEALALSLRSILRALAADEPVGEAVVDQAGDAPQTGTGSATADHPPDAQPSGSEHPSKTATSETSTTTDAANRARTTNEDQPAKSPRETGSERDDDTDLDTNGERDDLDTVGGAGRRQLALILGAAWDLALDGESPLQHGPVARLGVAFGRVQLAALLQTGLDAERQDPQTRVRLRRRAALVDAEFTFFERARLALALDAAAGVASFERTTIWVAPGLKPSDPVDKAAFVLGIALRARIALLRGKAASFGLELEGGALIAPAAPVLRYQGSSGRVEHALWPVQPHLHLGPYLRLEL
jgi:hypothetical protein